MPKTTQARTPYRLEWPTCNECRRMEKNLRQRNKRAKKKGKSNG